MGITKKLNYKHLVEKPNLCGPACIQMILLRRGIWMDQEEIAKEVDTKISKRDINKYKVKLKTTKDKNKFGISLGDFKSKKIQNFLKQNKLKVKVFYLSDIENVKGFIKDNLEEGNDIIANFWMSHFEKEKNWGHFSLISALNGYTLTIVDPEPSNRSEWRTTIKELTIAMGKKFDGRERGFAIIS